MTHINRHLWAGLMLAGLLLAATFAVTAADSAPDPRDLVEQTTGELLSKVAKERDALRGKPELVQALVDEIVTPHVDLVAVGRWMLGKYWREATAQQRELFLNEFRKLLVRTYATGLVEFTGAAHIKYISERVTDDGKYALVRTQIPLQGEAKPVDVAYRMHRSNDGWKVYDVVVEGVSMVTTYRTTFREKLDREGLDALLQELVEMNHRNEVAGSLVVKPEKAQ